MNRLQLATLLSWAGENGLEGRKRLQKVVYFLQAAGCPLNCQYTLHHYGPYSRDVADVCDEMVAAKLIEESGGPAEGRNQYIYQLPQGTRNLLAEGSDEQMSDFQPLGERLLGEGIWPLELGSTILFFYKQGGDWQQSLVDACAYKGVEPEMDSSQNALNLAQQVSQQIPQDRAI